MKHFINFDLCIYGATSGGIVAAVEAAKMGRSVLIVEPTRHLGGMTSGGLGWTDYRRKETIGGASARFYREVTEHYLRENPGKDAFQQGIGWSHEPHVAETIFRNWVADQGIEILFCSRVASVDVAKKRILSMTLDRAEPCERGAPAALAEEPGYATVHASIFIDASYEGDLMALAGVSYTTLRESRNTYGESMAGIVYHNHESGDGTLPKPAILESAALNVSPYREPDNPDSGLLPFIEAVDRPFVRGTGDSALQAYNFRLCLTNDPSNAVPIEPVGEYDPLWFETLGRRIEKNASEGDALEPGHFHHYGKTPNRVFKISPLPNAKSDVNNSANYFISSDFVGQNYDYPDADWRRRREIWLAHEDYQRGLHYFMQTDSRVPEACRREARIWGLAKDEFTDTGHWPFQLYVREARRMLGEFVMTQRHCNHDLEIEDSVGIGSYSLDSHLCRRFAWNNDIYSEGGFLHRNQHRAYPISYRTLLPKRNECENLAVLFSFSASHAAFSTLRMEPVLMILGESLAHAVDMALANGTGLQDIPVGDLQERLREAGQILGLQCETVPQV